MDNVIDYNVDEGLLGLGPDILLEILSEITHLEDVRQFLVLFQITPIIFIQGEIFGKLQGMKFIHSDSYLYNCTIAMDPIIKEGITRFEIIFENNGQYSKILGIADASCSLAGGKGPWEDR
ncbi:MAG: hypothetical protein EZS28_052322, partial [Streblomastix strix]